MQEPASWEGRLVLKRRHVRWLGEIEQQDEWIVCLKPAQLAGTRRDDEQETTPDHTFQALS